MHVRRRCGLLSNYFDYLLHHIIINIIITTIIIILEKGLLRQLFNHNRKLTLSQTKWLYSHQITTTQVNQGQLVPPWFLPPRFKEENLS